ncbi:MAG: hypothetical protein ACYC3G_00920 [Minisyncoccota bacterium]
MSKRKGVGKKFLLSMANFLWVSFVFLIALFLIFTLIVSLLFGFLTISEMFLEFFPH